MDRKVRVRFAPSPTGPLHMGGVRTALYNYLFAKKHGGDFILRIEDTDTARTVPGAEEYIVEALKWCGIEPNEGVGAAMYKQSNRNALGVYKPYVDKLIEDGNAYYAFDTAESLDAIRNDILAKRKSGMKLREFSYGVFTRDGLVNSLNMSSDELKKRLDAGEPYVIRMKMPKDVEIRFHDLVRGWITVKSHTIDDKVLFKSDGMPTYHLANVVDDYLMDISHVVRGEEWLPSMPLHYMLWKYLGTTETGAADPKWRMPEYAHLPLIMGPNGKLSKRDGDTLGFPVYPLMWTDPVTKETSSGYRENGYMPAAFNNMVALLGWNPGGNVEIMSMDEMVEKFSFERIGKSGAKFDLKKADWVNHEHMKRASNEELADMWLKTPFMQHGFHFTREYAASVCGLLKEKVSNINKFWEAGMYFFTPPRQYDKPVSADMIPFIKAFVQHPSFAIDAICEFTHNDIRTAFDDAVAASSVDAREAGKVLRLAVCGMPVGPPLFDVMALLGREDTMLRLVAAEVTAKALQGHE
jgi:glutamyl-tRNA synthetase